MLAHAFRSSPYSNETILHSADFSVKFGTCVPHGLFLFSQEERRLDPWRIAGPSQAGANFPSTGQLRWKVIRTKQEQLPMPKLNAPEGGDVSVWCWWVVSSCEFIETDTTIDAEISSSQLDRMQAELSQNRFRQLFRSSIILLLDNTRPHATNRALRKIEHPDCERLIHPPYSQTVHRVTAVFFFRCSTLWLEDDFPMRTRWKCTSTHSLLQKDKNATAAGVPRHLVNRKQFCVSRYLTMVDDCCLLFVNKHFCWKCWESTKLDAKLKFRFWASILV